MNISQTRNMMPTWNIVVALDSAVRWELGLEFGSGLLLSDKKVQSSYHRNPDRNTCVIYSDPANVYIHCQDIISNTKSCTALPALWG